MPHIYGAFLYLMESHEALQTTSMVGCRHFSIDELLWYFRRVSKVERIIITIETTITTRSNTYGMGCIWTPLLSLL